VVAPRRADDQGTAPSLYPPWEYPLKFSSQPGSQLIRPAPTITDDNFNDPDIAGTNAG